MIARTLSLALVTSSLLGCNQPAPKPEGPAPAASAKATAQATQAPRGVYRLDFALSIADPGKPPSTTEYTLNLEENSRGEIRMGKNVPLSPRPPGSAGAAASGQPAVMRQDVGLLIRCSLISSPEGMTLQSDAEMSDMVDTTIHKVSLKGDAPLTPGKQALIASSEDPGTRRRYQLTVNATKLR